MAYNVTITDTAGGTASIEGGSRGARGPAGPAVTDASLLTTGTLPDSRLSFTVSDFAKTLVDDADAATARATLGTVIGTDVQAYSANLDEYAAVNPTAAGLALLDDADVAAQRVTLGAQASDDTLTSLSGLSLAAGDMLYATAADTLTRLAKGSAAQVLTMNAGATAPEWALTNWQDISPTQYGATGGTFSASAGSLADETTEFQAMLDAAPSGAVINLLGRSWRVSEITIPVQMVVKNGRIVSTSATAGHVLVEAASTAWVGFINVTLEAAGVETVYAADQRLFSQEGTDTGTRAAGFSFAGCTIKGTGAYGIYAKFSDKISVTNTHFSEIAYAGSIFISCNNGVFAHNTISMQDAVGTASNAYGATWSHVSTGYSGDGNAGLPTAANPFCQDWDIDGNWVLAPLIWVGLDAHGGYGMHFINNKVYGAKHGIHCAGGSGDATNYAGYSNWVNGNLIDARNPDGTASGAVPGYAINVNGGSTVKHQNVQVVGNTIIGYNTTAGVRSIRVSTYVERFDVSGNIIDKWGEYGIETSTGSLTGRVCGNVFGAVTGSATACVYANGTSAVAMDISGNVKELAGTQPTYGLQVASGVTGRIAVGENNFASIATPVSTPNGVCHGAGYPGTIVTSSTSGTVLVDATLASVAPGVPLTLLFSSLSGAVSLDDITAPLGAIIIVRNEDATYNVTVTRANAALSGSVSSVLGRYDTVMLYKVAAAGNKWRALSGVIANG